jgi:hypothetical protein
MATMIRYRKEYEGRDRRNLGIPKGAPMVVLSAICVIRDQMKTRESIYIGHLWERVGAVSYVLVACLGISFSSALVVHSPVAVQGDPQKRQRIR